MTDEILEINEVLTEDVEQVDEQTPPADEEVLTENVEQEPTKTAEDLTLEIEKINAKKSELLNKLKTEKNAHLQTKTDMENLQTELEQLRNAKQEFENYKTAQQEMMALYALDVIPEYMDYMQFELKKHGYKVQYIDGVVLEKEPPKKVGNKVIDGTYKQVEVKGYAFLNANGELVSNDEIRNLRSKYGAFVYAYGNRFLKSHTPTNLEIVNTVAVAEYHLKETRDRLEASKREVEFYQQQINSLEEHTKTIAKAENSIIPMQFGLK